MSQLYLSYKQLLHVITFSGRQLCSLGLFDTYTFCPENYRCFMVFLCVSWLSWGCLVPSDLVYCILAPLIYGTSNQYWDDTTQCMVRIWIHFIHQNPTCSCNTITKHMASSHVWIFHKSAHQKQFVMLVQYKTSQKSQPGLGANHKKSPHFVPMSW